MPRASMPPLKCLDRNKEAYSQARTLDTTSQLTQGHYETKKGFDAKRCIEAMSQELELQHSKMIESLRKDIELKVSNMFESIKKEMVIEMEKRYLQ